MSPTQDESFRLTELTNRVAELEDKIEFILRHLQLQYVAPAGGSVSPQMQVVIDWLRKGNQIEAIKAYRVATNAGLAEAKDAVEKIGQANGMHFLSQANNKRA